MPNNNAIGTQPQIAPSEGAPDNPNTTPSVEGRWQEYWDGQRKINGLLFQADKNLITAISELEKVVGKILNLHAGDPSLQVDLSAYYYAIKQAKEYAEKVPAIDPPGCAAPPY